MDSVAVSELRLSSLVDVDSLLTPPSANEEYGLRKANDTTPTRQQGNTQSSKSVRNINKYTVILDKNT